MLLMVEILVIVKKILYYVRLLVVNVECHCYSSIETFTIICKVPLRMNSSYTLECSLSVLLLLKEMLVEE